MQKWYSFAMQTAIQSDDLQTARRVMQKLALELARHGKRRVAMQMHNLAEMIVRPAADGKDLHEMRF